MMTSFDHISQIDKRKGLSNAEFLNEYVEKSLPVVICDKPKWSAFDKFTPDFFKKNYGNITKEVQGKTYTLSEIIDLSIVSTPENKSPYPSIFDMGKFFPDLIKDVYPRHVYGKSNRLNSILLPKALIKRIDNKYLLFFGGKGCSFPSLHIDDLWVHTQITQIIGDKEFILYAPDQTQYLYPEDDHERKSKIDNISDPDLKRFPLFKNAKVLKVIVHPGETIFIPSGWWHTTYIHDFNLSFSMDHLNSANWDAFMDENYSFIRINHPYLAWTVKVYKVIVGKIFDIKESLFN